MISWKTQTNDDIWGATGNKLDMNSKGQRKLSDSGGVLFLTVELAQPEIE